MVTAATKTEPTNSTEAKAQAAREKAAAKVIADTEKAEKAAARQREQAEAKAAKANAPKRDCLCGCGTHVNGKSNFLPGHDARLVGKVARGEADAAILAPFPLLAEKAAKMKAGLDSKAQDAAARAAQKATKDAEKAEADKAKEAARDTAKQEKADAKAKAEAAKASKAAAAAVSADADVEVKVGSAWIPGIKVSEDNGKVTVRHQNAKHEWVTSTVAAKNVRAIQDL